MYRRIQRIHFVGIGGIGMSGLAELLHNQGYRITGSDIQDGPSVARLRRLEIAVAIGHSSANLADADILVFSSALRADNPELAEAARRKIPAIPRAEMLAEVMRLKDGVAVAGSHGKTTTTSLIAHLLDCAGLDPTAVIGGRVRAPGGEPSGTRLGRGDVLVAEADESDGSFLRLTPVIAVITNIDPEHLDHYGSTEALRDAFVRFADGIPFWGASIVCVDHPGVQAILPRLTRRVITYGFSPQADLAATDVEVDGFGMRFRVREKGAKATAARVRLPGRHNVANALASLAVARELDVSLEDAAAALDSFPGIERRFQTLGEAGGVLIVDDYGHHPTEVLATLAAARALHAGRIVVVFQPHRYSRTRDCFDEFATAFNDADLLLITEIHAAGEPKLPGVEGRALAEAIGTHGHRDVRFVADLGQVASDLPEQLRSGDLVITLGAGNITRLGPELLERLAALEARR